MNTSGDAAEQVVRLSLEGTEVALRLTGAAAKNVAAALYAVLKNKDKNKLKGRQRLTAMLKSGKELKVFTVGAQQMKQFAAEARRYGVVYCALQGRGGAADGLTDILVRAEDAAKINRIVERFKLAAVDTAAIQSEIEQSKAGRTPAGQAAPTAGATPAAEAASAAQAEQLLDDLLGTPAAKESGAPENPTPARMEPVRLTSPPSGPTSGQPANAAADIDRDISAPSTIDVDKDTSALPAMEGRPSVRQALRDIQAQRRQSEQAARSALQNEGPAIPPARQKAKHTQLHAPAMESKPAAPAAAPIPKHSHKKQQPNPKTKTKTR